MCRARGFASELQSSADRPFLLSRSLHQLSTINPLCALDPLGLALAQTRTKGQALWTPHLRPLRAGIKDAGIEALMNAQPPPMPKTHPAQLSYAHAAARASWVGCIIVFLLLAFGRGAGAVPALELVAFGLLAVAVVCGLVAFTGIRKYGCKGILAPALAGLTIAGLLLFIGITNFAKARARQIALRTSSQNQTTRPILPYLSKYSRGKVRFTYDGRYTISQEEPDKIALKHTESEVVIYPFNAAIDVDEQLKTTANQARALYQAGNMTDIRQTAVEQLHASTMSAAKTAAKMQLTCKARHGQVVTDIVAISSETNSVVLMHFYAQSQPVLAARMFETVLNSFLN